MLVALAKDKESLKVSRNVILKIATVSLIVIMIISFTPLGEFIFIKLFNTPKELMSEVKTAAVFALSLPFVYSLRAYSQGIIILNKKTRYLTYSVIIRIVYMIFLASILPRLGFLGGATIGMILWTSGIGLEASINFILSRGIYKNIPDKPNYIEGERDLSPKDAFSFVWPLLIMSFLWMLGLPIINSGLGRTYNPEFSIATFQISRNYVWIIMGFLETNMRQVSLIFGTSEEKIQYLKKFTLGVGVTLTLIIGVLALTPVGNWGLINIIGVSESIASASRSVMMILILLPIIISYSEYYMGLLMRLKSTKSLSIAKIINLGFAIFSVIGLSIIAPQLGAAIGAIGLIFGYTAEMIYVRYTYYRLVEAAN
jgi:O-antigen/teichoic acid export membrane protein